MGRVYQREICGVELASRSRSRTLSDADSIIRRPPRILLPRKTDNPPEASGRAYAASSPLPTLGEEGTVCAWILLRNRAMRGASAAMLTAAVESCRELMSS